ncbi:MAG: hypothetical protein LBP87_02220 [Planctomycetaceae bacterium]|jgi:hypothetical protein|nr:hypothetical protein [Planctomycetaceae bacterium]
MKIFQRLTFGLSLTSQMVLWLAGFFAITGLLWREPTNIDTNIDTERNCITVLALTVWIIFLIFLSRIAQQPKTPQPEIPQPENIKIHNTFWIPVLLIGFLLPFPFPVFYILLLGIAEIFRQLSARKMYKKNTIPAVTPIEKTPTEKTTTEKTTIENDSDHFDHSEQDDDFDDSVTQKIVRRFTETGKDRFEGTFLVGFQSDQLTVTIHIPFCPVFVSVPNIDVFILDDVDIKWNIFKPHNFGVRIDLKRNSCTIQQVRIMVVAE